jgi:peptidoglycan/xylan/chitin deacetylase (PgdA/CDA1 family)
MARISFPGGGSGQYKTSPLLPGKGFTLVDRAVEYYERRYQGIRVPTGAACVIRSDDSGLTEHDIVGPLLNARALTGSFVTNTRIQPYSTFTHMTTAQIAELRGWGHEIINHGADHRDPASYAAMFADIALCQQDLIDVNVYADSFVQPGNWTNLYVDTIAEVENKTYDRFFRGNFAASGHYVQDPSELGVTHPFMAWRKFGGMYQELLDLHPTTDLFAMVDEVIARSGFFHMLHHNYLIDTVGAGRWTTADYTAVVDYIKAKRDAGLIDVLSFTGSLFAEVGPYINICTDPDFELSHNDPFPATTTTWVGWEPFTGSPSCPVVGGLALSGTQVAQTTNADVLRKRMPRDSFAQAEVTIYARSSGANTGAVITVLGGSGGTATYTRTTAVTNAGWTKIQFLLAPMGPSTASIRFLLASDSGTPVYWDSCRIIKR